MAITDENTVLIIGAGASVEFGLPSGQKVFQNLHDLCVSAKDNVSYIDTYGISRSRMVSAALSQASISDQLEFGKEYVEILSRSGLDTNGLDELLNSLVRKISFQSSSSIDEFLYDNQDYYELGKNFSAFSIIKDMTTREKRYEENYYLKSNSFKKLYLDCTDTRQVSWLATLAERLSEGCKTTSDLSKNKLTIVTFNYDTIVEETILSMFRNKDKFSDIKDCNFLPIHHVNGSFGALRNNHISPLDFGSIISNFSDEIFMINEPVSEEVSKARMQAKKSINVAKKIYVMGFDFDLRNVKLIGLDKVMDGPKGIGVQKAPKLFALNYNGNIRLKRRLARLGAEASQIDGSASDNMGCSRACELGFLEQ